jgi:hypothetical protein
MLDFGSQATLTRCKKLKGTTQEGVTEYCLIVQKQNEDTAKELCITDIIIIIIITITDYQNKRVRTHRKEHHWIKKILL